MDHHTMHHHHHHNLPNTQPSHPIHWNYSSPSATSLATPLTSTPISNNNSTSSNNNTWTPPTTRGMKRAMSESDCDDIYSEESSKDHPSSLENDCHMLTRKKRRGVIEKKRRDRINSSLSELKRLVPSAFEKQGSAKLEKAEILQLTVDHLKTLHSKGVDSIGFDPQRFAMDYHIIGFRECASEVARYLVTIEGMDIQDPLRLRLMSHLQCFVSQRELSAKSTVTGLPSANWPTLQNSYQPNYASQGYQTYPATSPITPNQQHNSQQQNSFNSSYMSTSGSSYLNSSVTPQSPEYSTSGYGSTTANSTVLSNNASASNNASTTSPAPIQTTSDQQQADSQQQPIYTDLSNSNDRLLNLGGSYHHYGNTNQLYGSVSNNGYNNNNNNNNSKPYRPWGAEMSASAY